MNAAINTLKNEGKVQPDTDLSHLSPTIRSLTRLPCLRDYRLRTELINRVNKALR